MTDTDDILVCHFSREERDHLASYVRTCLKLDNCRVPDQTRMSVVEGALGVLEHAVPVVVDALRDPRGTIRLRADQRNVLVSLLRREARATRKAADELEEIVAAVGESPGMARP